jgi:hypothetical protein
MVHDGFDGIGNVLNFLGNLADAISGLGDISFRGRNGQRGGIIANLPSLPNPPVMNRPATRRNTAPVAVFRVDRGRQTATDARRGG